MNIEVLDRVRVFESADPRIEGQHGTVMGLYGDNAVILLFDCKPQDYDPAIVLVKQCIRKI